MTYEQLQQERSDYYTHYQRFSRMSTKRLQQVLGDLGKRRYMDNDIECYTEHRVAARVYIERVRKGEGLTFHMQNFLG